MPLSPEYKAMIAQEVAVRQTPVEQRRLIAQQHASLDTVRSPYLPINARLQALSQTFAPKPSE